MNTARIARHRDQFYILTNENFWIKMQNAPNFKLKPTIIDLDLEKISQSRKFITFKNSNKIYDYEDNSLRYAEPKDYVMERDDIVFIENKAELRDKLAHFFLIFASICGDQNMPIVDFVCGSMALQQQNLFLYFDKNNACLMRFFRDIFYQHAIFIKLENDNTMTRIESSRFPMVIIAEFGDNISAFRVIEYWVKCAKYPLFLFTTGQLGTTMAERYRPFYINCVDSLPKLDDDWRSFFFNMFIVNMLAKKKDQK